MRAGIGAPAVRASGSSCVWSASLASFALSVPKPLTAVPTRAQVHPVVTGRRATAPENAARRKGRKAIMVVYFAFSVLVIAVCTIEVSVQACARVTRTDDVPVECNSGVLSLMGAVERATKTASTSTLSEREAVESYRQSLEPEWSRRGDIRRACQGQPKLEETLDAVLRLGWGEEQSVRRDSLETTELRRRARELVARNVHVGGPAGASPSAR